MDEDKENRASRAVLIGFLCGSSRGSGRGGGPMNCVRAALALPDYLRGDSDGQIA
jgi:hypothetical protein